MKWQRGYRSSDVVDRRGQGGVGLGPGLLGPFVAIGSRFGLVGILAAVGWMARLGLLPRTRPIVAGEWAISD